MDLFTYVVIFATLYATRVYEFGKIGTSILFIFYLSEIYRCISGIKNGSPRQKFNSIISIIIYLIFFSSTFLNYDIFKILAEMYGESDSSILNVLGKIINEPMVCALIPCVLQSKALSKIWNAVKKDKYDD